MGKIRLDSSWFAARSTDVDYSGIQLTTSHPPNPPEPPWMEAVVPGTVLATLLKNKLIPDPFYGLENESILDIASSGNEYYTFWFFTSFRCKQSKNQYTDLIFRAINYSAVVYINGHMLVLPKGMFRRHCLDVTNIVHPEGPNFIAVLVYPPDHPGKIPPEGGQGGDHEIGKDVAAQYVQGWDWMTPIRDRNTGIWDEVSVSVTGPVKITDPHLVASFFDDYNNACLHATVELENKSSHVAECSLKIEVTSKLDGVISLVEPPQTELVSVPSTSCMQYTFPELLFYKPSLWWPNGMGKQTLYDVKITLDVKGHGNSDSWKHCFGFRKVESYIDGATGGRMFKVNGERVFIRGGNWILSDGLLRLSKERYRTEIKFHADMNFNMIRCWGGGIAERPEFYHYCDIYGLMVWQEFWITGDVDGRGIPLSNPDGPLDHQIFLFCALDTVKLLRNHPSLVLWVGGNEQTPPMDINKVLENHLRLHPFFQSNGDHSSCLNGERDPSLCLDGTRAYVKGSLWDGFADGKGGFTDGPYEIQSPENFFKPGFYNYGFNPEVGSVGMPVAATIRATIPPHGWQIPLFKEVADGYILEVPNPIWEYHKYIPYSKPNVTRDQIVLYGKPKDLDDFCIKAQLSNYIQYRALLEGWNSRMWSKYTGVLIWKTQNPWTGLRGQFYDHLLDQTAGFYGCRSAAEPIHVQLNLDTFFIEVVNTTAKELTNVAVEVSVWDLEGSSPYNTTLNAFSVPAKTTKPIAEMIHDPNPVYFLLLKLYNISNHAISSRNMYWLHSTGGDYTALESFRTKRIPLTITSETAAKGSSYHILLHIHNTSNPLLPKNNFLSTSSHRPQYTKMKCETNKLCSPWKRLYRKVMNETVCAQKTVKIAGEDRGVAFFLHFSVTTTGSRKDGDTRILPIHYSDNYFSLAPGEEMTITLSFDASVTPVVKLHGWNFHEECVIC